MRSTMSARMQGHCAGWESRTAERRRTVISQTVQGEAAVTHRGNVAGVYYDDATGPGADCFTQQAEHAGDHAVPFNTECADRSDSFH
jgi:hypothetical protein